MTIGGTFRSQNINSYTKPILARIIAAITEAIGITHATMKISK